MLCIFLFMSIGTVMPFLITTNRTLLGAVNQNQRLFSAPGLGRYIDSCSNKDAVAAELMLASELTAQKASRHVDKLAAYPPSTRLKRCFHGDAFTHHSLTHFLPRNRTRRRSSRPRCAYPQRPTSFSIPGHYSVESVLCRVSRYLHLPQICRHSKSGTSPLVLFTQCPRLNTR